MQQWEVTFEGVAIRQESNHRCTQLRGDVISRGGRHDWLESEREGEGKHLAEPEMLMYNLEQWGDM